jgi:hypothetical protein
LHPGGFSNFIRHINRRRSLQSVPNPSKAEIEADQLQTLLLSLARASADRYTAIESALRAICSFYEHQSHWFANGFPALLITSSKRVAYKEKLLQELRDALVELERVLGDPDQTELPARAFPQSTGSNDPDIAFTQEATASLPIQNVDSESSEDDESIQYLHTIYLESLKTFGEHALNVLRFVVKVEEQSVRLWFPGKQNLGTSPAKSAAFIGTTPHTMGEKSASTSITNTDYAKREADDLGDAEESGVSDRGPHRVIADLQTVFAGSDSVPDGEDDPSVIGNVVTACELSPSCGI